MAHTTFEFSGLFVLGHQAVFPKASFSLDTDGHIVQANLDDAQPGHGEHNTVFFCQCQT